MNREEFQAQVNVSRETLDKLEHYHDLLKKWQKAINLVSNTTLNDIWGRHIMDSAQIHPYVQKCLSGKEGENIVDFGSGAGFPALVLAIMGEDNIHVVESDMRKCTFMREIIRSCNLLSVTVHSKRIEDTEIQNVALITARALAPLDKLFEYSYPIIERNNATCLFLKGEKFNNDIDQAKEKWNFDIEAFESKTLKEGRILKCTNIKKI